MAPPPVLSFPAVARLHCHCHDGFSLSCGFLAQLLSFLRGWAPANVLDTGEQSSNLQREPGKTPSSSSRFARRAAVVAELATSMPLRITSTNASALLFHPFAPSQSSICWPACLWYPNGKHKCPLHFSQRSKRQFRYQKRGQSLRVQRLSPRESRAADTYPIGQGCCSPRIWLKMSPGQAHATAGYWDRPARGVLPRAVVHSPGAQENSEELRPHPESATHLPPAWDSACRVGAAKN